MTGRVDGEFAGHPVGITAKGRELLVTVPSVGSAWALRRNISRVTGPLYRRLQRYGVRLQIRVGKRWTVPLFPKPPLLLRLLLPRLRHLRA